MDGHECDGENLTKNGFTRDFTTFQHGGTLALSELEIDKSTAVPGIPPPLHPDKDDRADKTIRFFPFPSCLRANRFTAGRQTFQLNPQN